MYSNVSTKMEMFVNAHIPVFRAQKSPTAWLPQVKQLSEEMNVELSRTDSDIGRLRCQELALQEHDFVVLFQRLCTVFDISTDDEVRIASSNIMLRLVDLQLQHAVLLRWSLIWQRLAALVVDKRSSVSVQYNFLSVIKALCQHLLPDLALALSADALVRGLLENNAAHRHQILEVCAEIKTIVVVHIPAIHMSQYTQDFALLWQTLRCHPDARTRMVAYVLLYQLTQSIHHQPGVELYSQLVQGFLDSSEEIRRLCIHLAVYFVRAFADYPVSATAATSMTATSTASSYFARGGQQSKQSVSEETNRLADDAFAKTCDLVNDVEPAVRLDAITALSLMAAGVSEAFIMQTLEKKLMSNMRSKASAHDRQKDLYDSGEWVSGRKWTTDAPRGDIQAARLTLLPMRACGAFIHALEDELKIIRSAAVDSIVLIARVCIPFAVKSVDFVIDMFNDEIELVRQKAIQALSLLFRFVNVTDNEGDTAMQSSGRKLMELSRNQLRLRPDQLEIVLAVLQESSRDIRTALLHTVPRLAYTNSESLIMMLNAFLQNLQRNPADFDAVCESLKIAGIQQHEFVVELFDRLMQIHPYLDTPEPNLDDPNYVATVVLVTNACALQPSRLVHRFPKFFGKHYLYMSYRYPDLIPHIEHFSRLLQVKARQTSLALNNNAQRVTGDNTVKRENSPSTNNVLTTSKRIKLEAENGSAFPVPTTLTTDHEEHDDSVAILAHFKQAVTQVVGRLVAVNNNSSLLQQVLKQIAYLTSDCSHIINVGAPNTVGAASFLKLLTRCIYEFLKMQSVLSLSSTANVSSPVDLFGTVSKIYAENAELLTVFTGLSVQEKYWLLENCFLLAVFAVTRCNYRSPAVAERSVAVVIPVKRESIDIDFKEPAQNGDMLNTQIDADVTSPADDVDCRNTLVLKLPVLCASLLKLLNFMHSNRKSDLLQLSPVGLELDKHSPAELLAMPCSKFVRNVVGSCPSRNPHIFCPAAGLGVSRKTARLTVELSSAVPTLRTGGGAAVAEQPSRSSSRTPLTSTPSSRVQVHEFAESLAMHLDVGIELKGFDSSELNAPVTTGLCVVVDYPDGKRDITFLNSADIVDTDAVLHGRSNNAGQVMNANDLTRRLFAYSKEEDERKLRKSRLAGKTDDARAESPGKAAVINIRRRIFLCHESWSSAAHVTIYVAVSSDFAELSSTDNRRMLHSDKSENSERLLKASDIEKQTGLLLSTKPLLMPISDKESLLVRPRKS